MAERHIAVDAGGSAPVGRAVLHCTALSGAPVAAATGVAVALRGGRR